ncbi:MAG: hypothetical protein KF861_02095 [Planctomycetaceae bacterium]|nr:hypothetical protein [Planctomycetaceae bacterium]
MSDSPDPTLRGRLLYLEQFNGRTRLAAAMPARLDPSGIWRAIDSIEQRKPKAVQLFDGSVTELATRLRFPSRYSYLTARGAAPIGKTAA